VYKSELYMNVTLCVRIKSVYMSVCLCIYVRMSVSVYIWVQCVYLCVSMCIWKTERKDIDLGEWGNWRYMEGLGRNGTIVKIYSMSIIYFSLNNRKIQKSCGLKRPCSPKSLLVFLTNLLEFQKPNKILSLPLLVLKSIISVEHINIIPCIKLTIIFYLSRNIYNIYQWY